MNALTAILIAAYLGAVMVAGNGSQLWGELKTDAPGFVPWLVALLVLLLLYRYRGAFGPGQAVIGSAVIVGLLGVVLASSGAYSKALGNLGALLKRNQ